MQTFYIDAFLVVTQNVQIWYNSGAKLVKLHTNVYKLCYIIEEIIGTICKTGYLTVIKENWKLFFFQTFFQYTDIYVSHLPTFCLTMSRSDTSQTMDVQGTS